MHSRAHLLLKKDLANLERIPLQGISAAPLSNDSTYKWCAKIEGLEGTFWEGGVFRLNMTFTDDYNTVPPHINFMTIPFHPNVHPDSGVPLCGLLTTTWSESYDLQSLLLSLQCLLNNPETDSGCIQNHEAAGMYTDTPHTYKQLVLDCVSASLRIEAGMSPYGSDVISRPHSQPLSSDSLTLLPPNTSHTMIERLRPISFDDYHMFWKGLATSVPVSTSYKNDRNRTALKLFDSKRKNMKSEENARDTIESRMTNHLTLKYGISKQSNHHNANSDRNKPSTGKDYQQKRIAHLMDLYSNKEEAEGEINKEDHSGVTEIDELLKWTNSLDEEHLNN